MASALGSAWGLEAWLLRWPCPWRCCRGATGQSKLRGRGPEPAALHEPWRGWRVQRAHTQCPVSPGWGASCPARGHARQASPLPGRPRTLSSTPVHCVGRGGATGHPVIPPPRLHEHLSRVCQPRARSQPPKATCSRCFRAAVAGSRLQGGALCVVSADRGQCAGSGGVRRGAERRSKPPPPPEFSSKLLNV